MSKAIKVAVLALMALLFLCAPLFADSLTPLQDARVRTAIKLQEDIKESNAGLRTQLAAVASENARLERSNAAYESENQELLHSWRMFIGTWLLRLCLSLVAGFVLGIVAAIIPGPYGYILSLVSLVLMAVGSLGITLLPQIRDNLYFTRTLSKAGVATAG